MKENAATVSSSSPVAPVITDIGVGTSALIPALQDVGTNTLQVIQKRQATTTFEAGVEEPYLYDDTAYYQYFDTQPSLVFHSIETQTVDPTFGVVSVGVSPDNMVSAGDDGDGDGAHTVELIDVSTGM